MEPGIPSANSALSFPAKSDVSDFARLLSAEVGQGRLRVKAKNPVLPGTFRELLDRPLSRAMT
jgi:hypothetical protein